MLESHHALHTASRPDWECRDCGLPWPCPTRCGELACEYADGRTPLMLFLTACFLDACGDLPGESIGTLYARFLLWPTSAARDAPEPEAR